MTYASLSEAYGKDFSNQMNPPQQQQQYVTRKTNPNVINNNRSDNLREIKNDSSLQQEMDYNTHKSSFQDVSQVNNNNINYERAWDNNTEMTMMLSPKENLKQSLLKDRNIQSMGVATQEPEGYSQLNPYKNFNKTKCDDMFYHLDSCRKCQNKLKKRVIRYFNMLQQNNKSLLLPGGSGMGSELFIDDPIQEQPDPVPVSKPVQENFVNKKDMNSGIFLLLFGVFVLYALDAQK